MGHSIDRGSLATRVAARQRISKNFLSLAATGTSQHKTGLPADKGMIVFQGITQCCQCIGVPSQIYLCQVGSRSPALCRLC
jgi:hypothetical protein